MKNLLTLLLVSILNWTNAQSYIQLNKLLHKLEQESKINHNTELYYDLEGKKFLYLKDFPEKTQRWILEIKEGKSILVELEDDKKANETTSKIYTGDVVRKKHIVSVRVDKLESEKINIPITYLYHITYQRGIWYLIDANTGDRWIDVESMKKNKLEQNHLTQKEKRKLERLQRKQYKNRD